MSEPNVLVSIHTPLSLNRASAEWRRQLIPNEGDQRQRVAGLTGPMEVAAFRDDVVQDLKRKLLDAMPNLYIGDLALVVLPPTVGDDRVILTLTLLVRRDAAASLSKSLVLGKLGKSTPLERLWRLQESLTDQLAGRLGAQRAGEPVVFQGVWRADPTSTSIEQTYEIEHDFVLLQTAGPINLCDDARVVLRDADQLVRLVLAQRLVLELAVIDVLVFAEAGLTASESEFRNLSERRLLLGRIAIWLLLLVVNRNPKLVDFARQLKDRWEVDDLAARLEHALAETQAVMEVTQAIAERDDAAKQQHALHRLELQTKRQNHFVAYGALGIAVAAYVPSIVSLDGGPRIWAVSVSLVLLAPIVGLALSKAPGRL